MTANKNIAEETGVNAVVRCVLDYTLAMGKKKDEFLLRPVLHFSMIGPQVLPFYGTTTYAMGRINGPSKAFTENSTHADLETALNIPGMMKALETALMDIKAQEDKIPAYQKMWSAVKL